MSALRITNVKVFDGSGERPFLGEVLVEGNRIAAVNRPGQSPPRPGVAVLDGGGATLMPGLTEGHAHPTFPDASSFDDFNRLPPEEHTLVTMHNARTFLDCGYTSVVSAASAKPRLDVVVRNAINAGRIPGPRYLANSPEITVTGGLGDANQMHLPHQPATTFACVADGPDDMRRLCRLLVREWVDLLKLNISGDEFTPSARAEATVMTDAEVAACVEVAASRGLRVCAHARSADSVKMCVRHGIEIIYHANYSDEEALDLLDANRDRCFVVPAIGPTWNLVHGEGSPWGLTPEVVRARGLERELELSVDTLGRMRKRGIRVLPGGDYGFAWSPHGTYARDLRHFVEFLGFSPMETLVAATRYGGAIMGRPDDLGQVKPGYCADLLLVQGDPLDDIRILEDRARIVMIMKDGQLYKTPNGAAPAAR